ncbi:hypothetical protein L1887_38653 [Cichorium endivia]|nr:hypothetical protein L1887_38653 [Cichorium endivia]
MDLCCRLAKDKMGSKRNSDVAEVLISGFHGVTVGDGCVVGEERLAGDDALIVARPGDDLMEQGNPGPTT